jgi:hypothetical protein
MLQSLKNPDSGNLKQPLKPPRSFTSAEETKETFFCQTKSLLDLQLLICSLPMSRFMQFFGGANSFNSILQHICKQCIFSQFNTTALLCLYPGGIRTRL